MESINKVERALDFIISKLGDLQKYQQKSMLNCQEAANYLGISKSTLYKHTSQGQIAHYKPHGKLMFFKQTDLDKWLESKRIPSIHELNLGL